MSDDEYWNFLLIKTRGLGLLPDTSTVKDLMRLMVSLWESNRSVWQIAKELDVSTCSMYGYWNRMRANGIIPSWKRRSWAEHGNQHRSNRREKQVVSVYVVSDIEDVDNGDDHGVSTGARDKLLKRLVAVHGEPRFDLYPGSRSR